MTLSLDPETMRKGLADVVDGKEAPLPLDLFESSWRPRRLSNEVSSPEPPDILRVGVTKHLLYRGRTHSLIGESSSGKTWLALLASVEVLDAGGRVLWLDYESNESQVIGRLREMRGHLDDDYLDRFSYLTPSQKLENKDKTTTQHGAVFYDHLDRVSYDLAVIDSVTGAMSVEGLDTNSDEQAETFYRLIANPIANTGTAVLMLDHVSKSKESRGKDARGSGRKREALTGASYLMSVERPWRRSSTGEPVLGSFTLTVAKDREGCVGAIDEKVATGMVNVAPEGRVTIRLAEPEDVVVDPDSKLVEAILDHLRTHGPMTENGLRTGLGGSEMPRRNAVSYLLRVGVLTKPNGKALVIDEVVAGRLTSDR